MNVKIPEDVMWRDLGDEVVILNLATGIYFSMAGVGRRFWELVTAGVTARDELLRRMAAEYEVDAAELKRDLDSLVNDLAAEGLISRE